MKIFQRRSVVVLPFFPLLLYILFNIAGLVLAYTTIEQYKTSLADMLYQNIELTERVRFLEQNPDVVKNNLVILKMTRGIRNKNPMNIVAMSSKNPWFGQIGKDNQNHAVFATFEHGLRAGYLTLKGFYEKHGINTLIGITSRFCEGDALRYAKFLGKQVDVKYDEPIDVMRYMPQIMKAMIRFENGFDIFPDEYFIPYHTQS